MQYYEAQQIPDLKKPPNNPQSDAILGNKEREKKNEWGIILQNEGTDSPKRGAQRLNDFLEDLTTRTEQGAC